MQHKLFPLFAAAIVVLTVDAGSSKADIIFGNFATPPGPGGFVPASNVSGDFVANNPQTFTVGTQTYSAYGFSGAPGTSSLTALTLKPLSVNGFDESGIGENAAGPPGTTTCSDPECEIGGSTSVAVVSNTPLTDIIVSSVQFLEGFQLYTGDSLADLKPFGTPVIGGLNCSATPAADTCTVALPGVLAVGVQNFEILGIGDVLLAELSTVPAPDCLPVFLGVAAVIVGARLRDRKKSRSVLNDGTRVDVVQMVELQRG
jgi:hypothetical protein